MPAVLCMVGDDKESIGVFSEKLSDYGTFLPQKQSALRQTAVYYTKFIVLPATGKQNRVFSQGISCGLIPATAGERLIYAVIIQLGPE